MLRVLTYHRIARAADTPGLHPGLISATPEVFEQHMAHLARHYRVISLDMFLRALRGGLGLPKRAVLLTFDDGYRDFAEFAWPVLKRFDLPATLFVPTSYPDHPERVFWWDRLHQVYSGFPGALAQTCAAKGLRGRSRGRNAKSDLRLLQTFLKTLAHDDAMKIVDALCTQAGWRAPAQPAVLGWSELRRLKEAGVSLGAHSRTHALLTRVFDDRIRWEARGSWDDIQHHVGYTPPVFCYPGGAHHAAAARVLKEEGFAAAFTTLEGTNVGVQDPLRLRRTNITPRTGAWIFPLRLFRAFAFVNFVRRTQKRVSSPELPARGLGPRLPV